MTGVLWKLFDRCVYQKRNISRFTVTFSLYNRPYPSVNDSIQGCKFKQERKVIQLLYINKFRLYGESKDDLEPLMNTARIFTDDIKMKFGIRKCATLVIK